MKNYTRGLVKAAVLFCLLWSHQAIVCAEAVYLKSGRVMKGRIIEKTPDHIVLKTGEGESEVKSTIFLDDILKIETEENYSKEESLIKNQLEQSYVIRSVANQKSLSERIKSTPHDLAANIRKMVSQSLEFSSSGEKKEDGAGLSVVTAKSGLGSVSGVVRLPENWKEMKGSLYVYMLVRSSGIGFVSSVEPLYTEITQYGISGRDVNYTVDRVPAGKYGIFAVWDVAKPDVAKVNIKGKLFLKNLIMRGDYRGASGIIDVGEYEHKENVNFECATLVQADQVEQQQTMELELELVDIYYRRMPNREILIFMLVKNKSKFDSPSLSFDVYINDKKITEKPLNFGNLAAEEEKEFDLSNVYEKYKKQIIDHGGSVGLLKMPKIRVVWVSNREVFIEKTLFIFQ